MYFFKICQVSSCYTNLKKKTPKNGKYIFFSIWNKVYISICKQTLNVTKDKVFFFECFWLIRIFDSISNTDRGVHRAGGGGALGF